MVTKSEITKWSRQQNELIFEFKFKAEGVEKKPEARIDVIRFMTMSAQEREDWKLETVENLRNAEIWKGVDKVADSMIGPVEVEDV